MSKRKRPQKGLLGQPTDPKKQVLFFAGGEEWPSDDSDDSTYDPEKESEGKRNKGKKPQKMRKYSNTNKPEQTKHSSKSKKLPASKTKSDREAKTSASITSIEYLPPELILKIFRHGVQIEGCVPFFKRASRVCKRWHAISQDPILWENLDLSYAWIKKKPQTLATLGERYGSKTKEVILTGWPELLMVTFMILRDVFPLLESLTIGSCQKICLEGLQTLWRFSHLKSLKFGRFSKGYVMSSPFLWALQKVYEDCSSRLEGLTITDNNIPLSLGRFLERIFWQICTPFVQNFPLKVLDLSETRYRDSTLPVTLLQHALPRLEVLRIGFGDMMTSLPQNVDYPGFPKLQELSITRYSSVDNARGAGPDTDTVYKILNRSSDLKILNLRGCNRFTEQSLEGLPVTSLECFYAANSNVTITGLRGFLLKHAYSLLELDLGNTKPPLDSELSLFIQEFKSRPTLPLQKLDIANSQITVDILKDVLSVCPSLKLLNTGNCRNLRFGLKRSFTSLEALNSLKNVLSNLSADRKFVHIPA